MLLKRWATLIWFTKLTKTC